MESVDTLVKFEILTKIQAIMRLWIYLLAGVLQFANYALAQSSQEIIKVNQSGYYPNAPKIAVVTRDFTTEEYSRENFMFYILKLNSADTVFKKPFGKLKRNHKF